jgi:hypothetical protein
MADILDNIKSFKIAKKDLTQQYLKEALANKASAPPIANTVANAPIITSNVTAPVITPNVIDKPKAEAKPALQRDRQDFSKKFQVERETYETTSITKRLDTLTNYQVELSSSGSKVSEAKDQLDSLSKLLNDLESGNINNASLQAAKSQMATAFSKLDEFKKIAKVKGKSVFSNDFNITVAGADGDAGTNIQAVSLDPVAKPVSVKDLSSIGTIKSIVIGNKDSFGSKIQVSGNYLAIAAEDANRIGDDGVNDSFNDGAIDIFDVNSGNQIARFRIGDYGSYDSKYSSGGDFRQMNFGADFDIEGQYMVVGAPSTSGNEDNGAAFLYDIQNQQLIRELTVPPGDYDSNFGKTVEISDGKIFVSSYSNDSKIYTFDLAGNHTGTIESPTGAEFVGSDITASGDNIFISSSRQEVDGEQQAGEVYVYDKNTNAFKYSLKSPQVDANNKFGTKVEAFGDLLAVSETRADDLAERTGKVHLYQASTGAFVRTLETSDALNTDDRFGSDLAMSDKYIAVTASGDDTNGSNKGAVYVFDKETGVELAKITDSGSKKLGSSLAFNGDTLYVGDSEADILSGGSNVNKAGVVKKYDISSLGAKADAYKQKLAAPESTGVVTKGLDTNYLKKMDLDSLSTQSPDEVKETIKSLKKNIDNIKSYVSSLNSNLNQGLQSTSATISSLSKRLDKLVPKKNISVDSANIGVQANINPKIASFLIP